MVCLFEHLEDALRFNDAVDEQRIRIPNRTDIFGDQILMDENDTPVGIEEHLLPNATMLSIEDGTALVEQYGGICFPAHIDREANGIIATLGTFPESPHFACAEIHDLERAEEYRKMFSVLRDRLIVCGSDAHYLWDIRDASAYFELEDEPYSGDFVRAQLFRRLKGGLQ